MRARTRPGRLAAFDRWASLGGLVAPGGLVADVGFGVSAVTTYELSRAFPGHHVVGLELDAQRVALAAEAWPGLDLRQGGLERLDDADDVRLVRIANVGRGLTKEAAAALVDDALARVAEGGVVLEGSTDVDGAVSAFHQWRRVGGVGRCEALVLHTTGARGFAPWLFRDVLPRALRRDVRPGTAVHQFLAEWEAARRDHPSREPRAALVRSARALATERGDVDVSAVEEGFVAWRPKAPASGP
ncbi:MAG: methylase [Myxococcaceae bacterium]|nr:methylase [Myxococcaceae bacterium]